jgi:hypothetical protein
MGLAARGVLNRAKLVAGAMLIIQAMLHMGAMA